MRIRLKKIVPALLIAFAVIVGSAGQVEAGIIQYNNRAAWEVVVGTLDFAEDFNGFVADTDFGVGIGPLSLNGFSVVETGTPKLNINIIDVLPFFGLGSNVVDGTSFMVGATDLGGTSFGTVPEIGVTEITLTFDALVSSFGADFNGVDGPEMLVIDVIDSTTAVIGTLHPMSDTTFLGFVADAGENVASLRFRSSIKIENAQEAFGMDNAGGTTINAPVPEPTSLAIFGTICLVACRRRRKS